MLPTNYSSMKVKKESSQAEILTPGTLQCGCAWRWGLYKEVITLG